MPQRLATIDTVELHATRYPIVFKNGSSETVPAFGVMQIDTITGVPTTQARLITIKKPTSADGQYIINGPLQVRAGNYGRGRIVDPLTIKFTGSTPTTGDTVGPSAGSWEVSSASSGYTVLGGAESGLVLCRNQGGGQLFYGITATGGLTAATIATAGGVRYVAKGTGDVRRFTKTNDVGHVGEWKEAAADETWANLLFDAICENRPVTAARIDGELVVVSEGWKAAA